MHPATYACAQINLSLFHLNHVIHALGSRAAHVPYNGSSLTKLLADRLGGSTQVSIHITILLYYYTAILLYFYTTILLYFCTTAPLYTTALDRARPH